MKPKLERIKELRKEFKGKRILQCVVMYELEHEIETLKNSIKELYTNCHSLPLDELEEKLFNMGTKK